MDDVMNITAGSIAFTGSGLLAAGGIASLGVGNGVMTFKWLFVGNGIERGAAVGTDLFFQSVMVATGKHEYNPISTLVAGAAPNRYFISGAVGSGLSPNGWDSQGNLRRYG